MTDPIDAPTYWQRLKGHPGAPVAIVVTIFAMLERGWFGVIVGGLVCVPVLITARDQPV